VLVYGLHPNENPAQLADFVEQTGITFPVVPSNGTLNMFAFPPGVQYPYPRDVVIGKDLTVRSLKNYTAYCVDVTSSTMIPVRKKLRNVTFCHSSKSLLFLAM
jgi:hypothetical protein